MARTNCFRCNAPLDKHPSWCTPCLKAYKKTFNKGRKVKVIPPVVYVTTEDGLQNRLIPQLEKSDYMRFWSKAILTANPDICWNWNATVRPGKGSYGRFVINKKFYQAHRVAYFLQNKKDPAELCVLHKCDNPKCVNPNHLFLGTNNDNVQDKKQKGRHNGFKYKPKSYEGTLRGSKHGNAKLNEVSVVEIKNLYSNGGITMIKLAEKYGVSKKTVLNIIHNRTWKHA